MGGVLIQPDILYPSLNDLFPNRLWRELSRYIFPFCTPRRDQDAGNRVGFGK